MSSPVVIVRCPVVAHHSAAFINEESAQVYREASGCPHPKPLPPPRRKSRRTS